MTTLTASVFGQPIRPAGPDRANAEPSGSFPASELEDAVDVARHGRDIDAAGVPYAWDGVIPAYGMLGFTIAYAKVGKTTFGQTLAAHIAMGRPFLGRQTTLRRVLVLAAEDPPEYTAWMARHLDVDRGRMVIRRLPLILSARNLQAICATVREHHFGLVLIASWQAVVRGLMADENDNAGAVLVVEAVKEAARTSGIPWLIDAHSGKGEDQADDADPSRAMRGASSAAGSADYALSLRYGNGTFGTERRLSGKGRFVSFAPILMDFDPLTTTYTLKSTCRDVASATTWRLISETGVLAEPRSVTEIARGIGMIADKERLSGTKRSLIIEALKGRPDVGIVQVMRRGQKTTLYKQLEVS